jgi:Uma2 family endonuclease
MTASATQLLSLEEWGDLDEHVAGELVDGVLVEEEMPSALHETIVAWLLVLLTPYFRARGGFVFASGLKLAIRPRRGRLADVVCFGPGKKPEARGLVRTAPDVVIEVVSPSPADERRDRIEKPDDYATLGVRYYWLVDPELRSFEVWELGGDGRYVRARSALSGRVLDVPGCDGLTVDLDALWAEVDRLLGTDH